MKFAPHVSHDALGTFWDAALHWASPAAPSADEAACAPEATAAAAGDAQATPASVTGGNESNELGATPENETSASGCEISEHASFDFSRLWTHGSDPVESGSSDQTPTETEDCIGALRNDLQEAVRIAFEDHNFDALKEKLTDLASHLFDCFGSLEHTQQQTSGNCGDGYFVT